MTIGDEPLKLSFFLYLVLIITTMYSIDTIEHYQSVVPGYDKPTRSAARCGTDRTLANTQKTCTELSIEGAVRRQLTPLLSDQCR